METYRIVAFSDNVGYACSVECADDVIADINGDHGDEADAGMDPVTIIRTIERCMSCGKEVS